MSRKRSARRKHALSHSHWKLGSLSSITAIVSVVIGGALFTTFSTDTASAAPLAEDLGLLADNDCGTETATFRVIDGAPQRTVFKLNDVWHKNNPCLEDLTEALRKQPATAPIHNFVYYQMLYVLSRQKVQFSDAAGTKDWTIKNLVSAQEKLDLSKIKRLIYLSAENEPYDGMGQSDMAVWAMNTHRAMLSKTGANPEYTAAYKAVGIASMETITALTNNKGLRSQRNCANKAGAKCSWFHSRTNDEGSATEGRTLNKHLQIVRDLWDFSKDLRAIGSADLVPYADKYSASAVEGAHQLAYGPSIKQGNIAPNLFDFVARKPNGEQIQRSWFYYGFTPTGKGYYLEQVPEKNCGYHKRDISLIVDIFRRFGGLIDKTGFDTPPADGSLGTKSILEYIVRAYEIKLGEDLFTDSETSTGGYFGACEEGIGAAVTLDDLAYLRSI